MYTLLDTGRLAGIAGAAALWWKPGDPSGRASVSDRQVLRGGLPGPVIK